MIKAFLRLFQRNRNQRRARSGSDQRCPHCHTWQSECQGWSRLRDSLRGPGCYVLTCGHCDRSSVWDFNDMVARCIHPKEEKAHA